MRSKSINGIHAARLKDIRGFVDFDFDLRKPLTKYQKTKIKRYYDEIDKLTAVPHQVYRPRTKQHLKAAQKFSGQQNELKGLKVAFVPNNGKKAKIKFNDSGEIKVVSTHVETSFIPFDEVNLINDPARYTEALIKNRKEKQFTVSVGDGREIPKALNKRLLPQYIQNLTQKYGADLDSGQDLEDQLNDEDLSDEEREELKRDLPNNHYLNWLNGINAHGFQNQDDFDDYFKAKQNAKQQLQKKRKAKKKAIKRKYKK